MTPGRYPFGNTRSTSAMRPGNDVNRDEFADSPGGGGAGIGRGLDRADIATDQHGDIAGADVFGPISTTFAALTIASAASTEPIKPRVSTIPSASRWASISLTGMIFWFFTACNEGSEDPAALQLGGNGAALCGRRLMRRRKRHQPRRGIDRSGAQQTEGAARYVTSIGLPSGAFGLLSATSIDATAGLVSLLSEHEAAATQSSAIAPKLLSSRVLQTLRCMR